MTSLDVVARALILDISVGEKATIKVGLPRDPGTQSYVNRVAGGIVSFQETFFNSLLVHVMFDYHESG